MKSKKGYIAGPLFNEAEINQRLLEGKLLNKQTNIKWFNPIEAPINDKAKLPSANDIFWGDTKAVLEADYIIADLTNNDVGVAYELGIAWAINYIKKLLSDGKQDKAIKFLEENNIANKNIIGVISDIRLKTSGEYKKEFIPWGINQYVVGGLLDDGKIVYSFQEALKILKK